MITRAQYMENYSELHNAYYLQFATASTFQFVRSSIGIDKLKTSKDKYFNDIIKHGPFGGWIWDSSPVNSTLMKELGEIGERSLPSKSTHTCVGKAAARHLLNEEQ